MSKYTIHKPRVSRPSMEFDSFDQAMLVLRAIIEIDKMPAAIYCDGKLVYGRSDPLRREKHRRWSAMYREREKIATGEAYYVESGTDCDCVQYCDRPRRIEGNWYEFDRYRNEAYEWADGLMYFSVLTKEEAEEVMPFQRDLAMEAHENGHPHWVTSATVY